MYNVSSEERDLFRRCYRQIAKINVSGVTGLTEITDRDLLEGGFSVDRYCFSSNTLEIGTAIASELSIELDNHTGKFDSFDFDGAVLTAYVGIKKWDAKEWENAVIHYIPVGVFVVDEKIKNRASITLNALDKMVYFDKPYDSSLSYPATLGAILADACTQCGVVQETLTFPNSTYSVSEKPTDDESTYRQIIQWVAQLAGANAFIDWNGKLRLKWFEATGISITPNDRYDSTVEEYAVTITGVKISTADGESATAGTTGCMLNIEGNGLAQDNLSTLASNIQAVVGGFTYLPYSCVCRPMPYLYPMDKISFVDRQGNSYTTIVSAITYTKNGATNVSGEGTGETEGKRTPVGGATAQEKVIIEKAKAEAEKVSRARYELALSLNQLIGNAFGLYETKITENGATTYYFHDKSTLTDSTVIYTFNAGGFAWTDNWNGGSPVWKTGFTQDGNAVFKILSAYKIQTDYLDAGCVTAAKIAQSYKTSVTNEINAGDAAVTQAFTAADGVLDSRITAEVTRATGAESSLSSRVTQTESDISAEVTRAGNAESALSSRITQTADDITAEVTRATGAESSLSSRITANATAISAKVSSTGGTGSSFAWSLTSSGFVLTSNNTNVMEVTDAGAVFSGTVSGAAIVGGTIEIGEVFTVNPNGTIKLKSTMGNGNGTLYVDNYWIKLTSGDSEFSTTSTTLKLYDNSYVGSLGRRVVNYTESQPGRISLYRDGVYFTIYMDHSTGVARAQCPHNLYITGTWTGSSSGSISSDRNKKNSIALLDNRYGSLFDRLIPRVFKYNDGTSNRLHSGFVAQEVADAMAKSGVERTEFAALCITNEGQQAEEWSLRYDEFIALCVDQIQKLKARVAQLESEKGGM